MTAMQNLVQRVKAHALAHYNDGGWDAIVECWEDDEIERHLRENSAKTPAQAIASFRDYVSTVADRQVDADNSAF